MAIPKMSDSPVMQFRTPARTSSKIIFISCEGCVTEEEYFQLIYKLFPNTKSKVQIVSVKEDLLSIPPKKRKPSQWCELNRSAPLQLLKKIDDFKNDPNKSSMYQFNKYPCDEFWIVADVDDHTNQGGNLSNWNQMLAECKSKGYYYAISNPFFELWLLLHHDDANTDISDPNNDAQWAVTSSHSYQRTDHFRKRLSNLGVGFIVGPNLVETKHIDPSHYTKKKVNDAIARAKKMDTEPPCDYPTALGTTVYRLLDSIAQIDSQY